MELLSALQDNVLQYIQMIKWQDYVDVLLMTFIIYGVVTRLRTSSAARVFKAIVLILILSWVTDLMELNVISWLIGKVLDIGFLALIIVFQPEIRRVLEHVGSGRLRSLFSGDDSGDEVTKCIRSIVAACTDMSKQKVGALIVFERDMRLDDYFKAGTVINAEVSVELVKNIFFPKAALHDGAMIIRDCRIEAAGCVLPLTSNANLSRDLGMRHRAGIGMSESSDAIVVIVSEETGSISVAQGGMLKRHLAPETLEKLLSNELVPQTGESQSKLNLNNLFKVKKNDKKDNQQ